jgi:lauroyl/myristoyl acyltransferase
VSEIEFRFRPSRRAAVLENLNQIASAGHTALLDPGARTRVARRIFESFHLAWIESFSTGSLREGQFRFRGSEHLYRALAQGRGAILAAPHVGSWELAGAALAGLGLEVHAVSGVQVHPFLSEALRWRNERRGIRIHTTSEGFTGLARALRRGALVVLLADGDVYSRSLPTPFFGRRVAFPAGPAILARRAGVPILHAHAARAIDGGNRLCFEGMDAPDFTIPFREDLQRLTALVARSQERNIAAHVAQWGIFRPLWSADLA